MGTNNGLARNSSASDKVNCGFIAREGGLGQRPPTKTTVRSPVGAGADRDWLGLGLSAIHLARPR
jgi:hypothetical protein